MILVTGGTGFVGEEVVKTLLSLGYHVRLLVRDPRRVGSISHHPRVQLSEGDALRPDTLPAAMTGVRAVVHLIGFIAETSKITFKQGHVETTHNILAAAKQAGVTRWIQMSAAGTRPNARSRYHQTKWQAEELIRQSGLDWTIFRPSLIYGHDHRDRLLNLLRRFLSSPINFLTCHTFPLLEGGRPLVQPVSVREVAHCFAHAVAASASINQTYDLVGPIAFSWREMINQVATHLGHRVMPGLHLFLALLRILLNLIIVLLPLAIVVALFVDMLSPTNAELEAGKWIILVLLLNQWRRVIAFTLPAAPLLLLGENLKGITPRALQFNEQLKMAMENNVGDPLPAAQTFGYQPESFTSGLNRIFPQKTGS